MSPRLWQDTHKISAWLMPPILKYELGLISSMARVHALAELGRARVHEIDGEGISYCGEGISKLAEGN